MIQKFEEFVNESNYPRTGFPISKNVEEILLKLFAALPIKKFTNIHFFNSGYIGLSFIYNSKNYLLMYKESTVGLEDHSMGGVQLVQGGFNNLIYSYTEKDDYTRGFGNPPKVNIEKVLKDLKKIGEETFK